MSAASLRSPARFTSAAARLVELWKSNPDKAVRDQFADRVTDAWIQAQAYRLQTFGTVTRLAAGGELGAESSVTKVFWSDLDVAINQTALDLQGADAELADSWTESYLFALGGPIYAGTNEIQRNIIAETAGPAQGGQMNRDRRTAARFRRQHRRGPRLGRPSRSGAPGPPATPHPVARCGRR